MKQPGKFSSPVPTRYNITCCQHSSHTDPMEILNV